MDTSDKTLLVIDARLFPALAQHLAPSFRKTYYAEVRCSAFPSSKDEMVGNGLPGVERLTDPWGVLDEVDLVVFPDVTSGHLPEFIQRYGKPVFGSKRQAANFELDRWEFRKVLKEVGLPVAPATRVTGTEDLEKILRKTENRFVKYGRYRGDMETYHHVDWFRSEEWFYDLVQRLGARRPLAQFIVEEAIEDAIEAGFDWITVDGQYAPIGEYSYEQKGDGHIGQIVELGDLPDPLRRVLDRMAPVLKRVGHRGWFSGECRIDREGNPYFIDPTMRCPNPPTFSLLKAYENWPEIVSAGARGELVTPKPRAKFVAELMLASPFVFTHFLPVEVKKGYEERVTWERQTIVEGKTWIVPDADDDSIGSVLAIGDTTEATTDACLEALKGVDADKITYDATAFDNLEKTIAEGEKHGVGW